MASNRWLLTKNYSYLADWQVGSAFPDKNLELSADAVHLWLAELEIGEQQVETLAQSLSQDELQRANRFRFDHDRHAFIAGRGILRIILGAYLNRSPNQITFQYGDRGKPEVAHSGAGSTLQFNVSHSQNRAIYAITRDRRIGVDLEYQRNVSDMERLAKRFFTSKEHAILCALPPEQQARAFFQLWTCKEAYLKAIGEGLVGLGHVELTIAPNQPFSPSGIGDTRDCSTNWNLAQFQPFPDFMAALAVEGDRQELNAWKFGWQ